MAGNIDLTPETNASDVIEAGAKVAGDIIENTAETASDIATAGIKAAGDLAENVVDNVSDALSSGGEVVGAIGEKAVNLVENTVDLASDVVDKVADVTGDILNVGASALETGANIVGDVLKFTPGGALINGAVNLVSGLFGDNESGSSLKPVSTYSYYLPGIGGEVNTDEYGLFQSNPLLNSYSPRLFGAPHQLTHLNDMRLLSSKGDDPGPVGDFYLEKILTNAEICNIVVGRAVFTGGMNGLVSGVRNLIQYASAMKNMVTTYLQTQKMEGIKSQVEKK